jgi:anti-sigma factor RsiW
MRHIPEEELHAYLDQALSRAQAVEIESHLAACARCGRERDAIAGLRDRTTALLSTLAPAHSIQRPAWAELRRRHHLATARRARIIRAGVWAASLVAAIGLGYGSHWWLDHARGEELAGTRDTLLSPAQGVPAATTVVTPVVASRSRASGVIAGASRPRQIERLEFDTLSNAPTLPASGVWRTESLERAVASGLTVPRVAGLPVLQIQVQDAPTSSSSLVAVEQVLTGGELVRTIEGPADEMAALDRRAVASAADADAPSSVSMRTGNRMLLMTARIPADSLRALLARLRTK